MESGWSLKHLHRLIVTSGTYRQDSRQRPDLARKDSANRLLGRQNRLRLEAEIVRDAALQASGLLNPQVGGPGIHPPQPKGIMTLGQMKRLWTPDPAPYRFRRGLYTHFWRATPHPALMVFDAPDSLSTCTRRNRSNTPLQALTLLNDPGFFEYAQGLAARGLQDLPADASEADRLAYLFRRCVFRKPEPGETRRLLALLHSQRRLFQENPASAETLFSKHAPRAADPAEQAAWMQVGRVLLNLDETITRD